MKYPWSWTAILSLACVPCPAAAPATHETARHSGAGCEAFTANLSREFAAMKAPAILLAASADKRVNPVRLEEGQHIAVTLLPQNSVSFAVAPGRQRKSDNPTAGLLFFKSGHAGRYRIALTSHHWIDLIDGDKSIESASHEGRKGCELLSKVVEFELPANRDLVVQLSGDGPATAGVVVTAVAKE
jgi:hypothetical protein